MASSVIILECVNYRKTSIPCIVLYEVHIWNQGTVYTSPGGNIDSGETPEEAAIRETEEEAFLKIDKKLVKSKDRIKVGTTYFWVVKLEDIKRDEYIKARFCNENLKKYQKETHDLTKVAISEFKKCIRNGSIECTDIHKRKIKLRRAFFKCLTANDDLIKKIDEVLLSCPCD